jgi:hypothetical protein
MITLHKNTMRIYVEYLSLVFQTRRDIWHRSWPRHPHYWSRLLLYRIFARLMLVGWILLVVWYKGKALGYCGP